MRWFFRILWRTWRPDFVRKSTDQMPPDERQQLIADLLFRKFEHVHPDDVKGLVCWAINFSEMSDDYLLTRWSKTYDCR